MALPPGIDVKYVDLPALAETFLDSIENFTFNGGLLRFNLCSIRLNQIDPSKKPTGNQYPVARVVMPLDAAIGLFNNLNQLFSALEKSGVIKRESSGSVVPPSPASH